MGEVVLPVELVKAFESGGWVVDGGVFRCGLVTVGVEASPSVFGSWKWVTVWEDRNESRVSYGVTKSLCEFVRRVG